MEGSYLKRKEYGFLMSSEAKEKGLEQLLEISWRVSLQKYFDKTMSALQRWRHIWPTHA